MVKGRRRPSIRTMALGASMAEIILHVIGIAHRVVIADVTRITIIRRPGILIVNVAIGAGYCQMRSDQGKSGRAVVKRRWPPGVFIMAHDAILRIIPLLMIWI